MSTTTPTPTTELDFLGVRARVLSDARDDGLGVVELIEMPAGDESPLHVHHREDEGFYVQEGELTLYLPGRELTLRAGDYLLAPRGVPHSYRVGDGGARSLVLSSPAGFERFVVAASALDAPDPATLAATAAEFGIEILGPPGARP